MCLGIQNTFVHRQVNTNTHYQLISINEQNTGAGGPIGLKSSNHSAEHWPAGLYIIQLWASMLGSDSWLKFHQEEGEHSGHRCIAVHAQKCLQVQNVHIHNKYKYTHWHICSPHTRVTVCYSFYNPASPSLIDCSFQHILQYPCQQYPSTHRHTQSHTHIHTKL